MYSEVLLTLLTIATGVLTIATFINGRKKDGKEEGKSDGAQAQKLTDIDERTKSIQQDVRELRTQNSTTAILATTALEKAQSAHDRIDRLERDCGVAKRKEVR